MYGPRRHEHAIAYPPFGSHSAVINAGDSTQVTTGTSCTIAVGAGGTAATALQTTRRASTAKPATGCRSPARPTAPTIWLLLRHCCFGHRASARSLYQRVGGVAETVNTACNYVARFGGRSKNVNVLSQTITIDNVHLATGTPAGDVDPVDHQVHIRWGIAPLLQNPGHNDYEQPYFFTSITNTTTNTVLAHDFNFANQSGVPWQIDAIRGRQPAARLLPIWQLVDVAPASLVSNGDHVRVDIYVSGCSRSPRGRAYVDGFRYG